MDQAQISAPPAENVQFREKLVHTWCYLEQTGQTSAAAAARARARARAAAAQRARRRVPFTAGGGNSSGAPFAPTLITRPTSLTTSSCHGYLCHNLEQRFSKCGSWNTSGPRATPSGPQGDM